MELILQKDLPHQVAPVDCVCGVFSGVKMSKKHIYANPEIDFNDKQIYDNIAKIQENIDVASRNLTHAQETLNLDIKMETGTGKTYVYVKTMYELFKEYGINKFIIFVPTLPIKAGVKSFVESPYVQNHFKNVCGYNCDIDLQVLSAKKNTNPKTRNYFPGTIREFVEGTSQIKNKIYVLLLNMQLLGSNSKILSEDYDNSVNGSFYNPFAALKATRPFVIIDEPHKFLRENKKAKTYSKIIENLLPQCVIRYGATFPEKEVGTGKNKIKQKDYSNLLYNLDAYQAFSQNLIKGVAKEHFNAPSNNNEMLTVIDIKDKQSVRFKYQIGGQKKFYTLSKGDPLSVISGNLEGVFIEAIDKGHVYFSNGKQIAKNEPFETSIYMSSYTEGMIKLALDRHFEIEEKNFAFQNKIKTLALFFIDDIDSYRNKDKSLASFANTFDKLLTKKLQEELKKPHEQEYTQYLKASLEDVEKCRGAYFSQDNLSKEEKIEEEIKEILLDKTKLLSIKDKNGNFNTRRFLFSKWTLREGWDNPNIFTICKLRSSGSEISKLQEVGRGLRLPVDQAGNRISNEEFVLNYIVDFTEADFAEKLVKEINEGIEGAYQISDKMLQTVANKLGKTPEQLMIELLTKDYIDTNKEIKPANRQSFFDEYPDFAVGVQSNKIFDRNKSQSNQIGIRPKVYDKLKDVWQQVTQKYLLFYKKNIDVDFQSQINALITPDLFQNIAITSLRNKLVAQKEEISVVKDAGMQYLVANKMDYCEFLKKANKATSIPINVLHNAFINFSKNTKIKDEWFNNNTLSAFINRFFDWKIKNLQDKSKIEYKKADLTIKESSLTNFSGTVKSSITQGRLGNNVIKSSLPSKNYLYDVYAYDSRLEEKNLLTSTDGSITAFAKLPKSSVQIPVITGGSNSPDFMYKLNKNGKDLALIIESKDVENMSQLRDVEKCNIFCAKLFFETLSKNGTNIKYRCQFKNDSLAEIIKKA